MDLTSGYYQFPIHKDCQEITAFMTNDGLYEWTRVPMGPSGAGSYFSKTMHNEVFNGLVQSIVEIYLDDLIVPANTHEQCIARLEQVFHRLSQKGMTDNPDKSVFGLSEVEYVGHTVDGQGYHFTRSRLDSVLDFDKPVNTKHLYSFLGFANYFNSHINNFSSLTGPLYELTKGYKKGKSKQINWTVQLNESWHNTIKAVHECPKLFYLNDEWAIYLKTDASDYGIGAYLYQVNENEIEYPIAFISKSLDARMRKWDVPQKEGYAIFYAFLKLDRFLRDRRFTLLTDHKNLTSLSNDYGSNQKVQRWLQTFQYYDYHLGYVKGEHNIVADGLSRLCAKLDFVDNLQSPKTPEGFIQINNLAFDTDGAKYKWFTEVHNSFHGHSGIAETMRRLQKAGHNWNKIKTEVQCVQLILKTLP